MKSLLLMSSLLLFSFGTFAQTAIPNTFTANTPAKAAEVNANFKTLVDAINAQDTRIKELENKQIPIHNLIAGGDQTINGISTTTLFTGLVKKKSNTALQLKAHFVSIMQTNTGECGFRMKLKNSLNQIIEPDRSITGRSSGGSSQTIEENQSISSFYSASSNVEAGTYSVVFVKLSSGQCSVSKTALSTVEHSE